MKTSRAHDSLLAQACRQIETADPPPTLSELAQAAGLSPSHFHRCFKARLGLSPKAYAQSCRARRMEFELAVASSITAAIVSSGHGSSSRFYEKSPARLGMEARVWRNGGLGEQIVFALGQTGLGALLVGATQRGLCAIWLGDDAHQLLDQFQSRFHRAHLIPGSEAFHALVARVGGMIEQSDPGGGFPLDIRGTAFQERVWRALSHIPPGSTVSYAQLAQLSETPSAVRAVASACAANELAYIIPCHRVVRGDDAPGGYRWGLARKCAMLDNERLSVSPT